LTETAAQVTVAAGGFVMRISDSMTAEHGLDTPRYYAVIPASVRYDSGIPANAKLLYGEITALCGQDGYCREGNAFFAGLYKTTERAVINWINALKNAGYITVGYASAEPGETGRRVIKIPA
jgi:hypothetical protein